MSASVGRGASSLRYKFIKLAAFAEECVFELSASTKQGGRSGMASLLQTVQEKFKTAMSQPLTTQMYIAGAAMAPALNRRAIEDKDAIEKVIVRLIPRASSASLSKGDVIAFTSPLASAESQHVLIRRVAALEGEEMVSGQGDEEPYVIPNNHCWVLADNEQLQPPNVIDSRTFGHIPYNTVLGRVIYAASSATDHGPVQNSPEHKEEDAAVLEAEVDPDALFAQAQTPATKDSKQE